MEPEKPHPSDPPATIRTDGLWLDDFAPEMTFTSETYALTVEEIVAFAQRYDPQVFHLDAEKAKGTFFGGLAASGWLTAAITMRLFQASMPIATGIIGTDIAIKWPTATRPGDVLQVTTTVVDVVPSRSRPDRGSVLCAYDTTNQSGEIRQQTTARSLAWRRP